MLGAGDADGARAAAVRMIGWSVVVGHAVRRRAAGARATCIPHAFTSDDGGDRARARDVAAVRGADAGRRRGVRARRHPHRRLRHALPDVEHARGVGGLRPAGAARAARGLGHPGRVGRARRAVRGPPAHARRALPGAAMGAHRRARRSTFATADAPPRRSFSLCLALLAPAPRRARPEQPVRPAAAGRADRDADARRRHPQRARPGRRPHDALPDRRRAAWSRSCSSAGSSRATRAARCPQDRVSEEAERRRHDPRERHRRQREKERARKKTRAQKQARKAHRKR